jgi:hypothetical protein
MIFFAYLVLIILAAFIISYTALIIYLEFLPGAFYYPTENKSVQTIFKNIHPQKNDLLIDLGSGDGRIIIAAAQKGIKSIGYELNPLLIHKSRQKIKKLNLSLLAKIEAKNFWKADFNKATVICIYQFPQYMEKLEKIFQKTNHPITIITNSYPLPKQKPYLVKDKLYFYKFH